jgi:hypothetical protein
MTTKHVFLYVILPFRIQLEWLPKVTNDLNVEEHFQKLICKNGPDADDLLASRC